MKKQKLQLTVLVIVLIVLGGGYLGLRRYNTVQSQKASEETEGEALTALESEDIIRFSYDYEDEEYTFEKEEDTWYYAADHELSLTQYRLNAIAAKLAALTALDTIEGAEDLTQYGLDEPSRTFSFETEAESYVFYIGDYNELADVYYICKPSGNTVYTVASTVITAFNMDLEDVVDTTEEESEEENEEESADGSGTETEGESGDAGAETEGESGDAGTEAADESEAEE